MRAKKKVAALLAVFLLLTLTGCSRPNRRPALPAAPLQSSFTAESADADTQKASAGAPMMKSTMMDAAPEPEQTTQELLEAFVQPLDQQDALYQDYTEQHRSQYKKLRQRPEEVIELVLPELLSDVTALERYSDDTSRATLLYCLFKDTLQNEPFSWDGDSYRYLSDMLAEFIQFVSGHVLAGDEAYFDEYAPLMGFSAAVMQQKPALRLNMTPCAEVTNAQALTNAKLVFAAALDGRDAEKFGFAPWPDGMASGFDFTTEWTLTQSAAGEVTLTAVDPDTNETASFTYIPNAAELHSLADGYGALLWTKTDGEQVSLASENRDRTFHAASYHEPIQDDEIVLENGVETGMDYNTVLALIGTPDQVWSDTMAGMGLVSQGVIYSFQYDDQLVMRLENIGLRLAEDAFTNTTSELPTARGIRLGDTMQFVFEKMPAVDTTLKKWALQEIYGWADEAGGTATLSFVADSYYVLEIKTSGGHYLSITFARLDNTVKWADIW